MTRNKRNRDGSMKNCQYTKPDFMGGELWDSRYAPRPHKWSLGMFGTRQQYVPECGIYYKDWECSYPDVWCDPITKVGCNCVWYLVGLYWIPHGNSPLGSYRECWSFYVVD